MASADLDEPAVGVDLRRPRAAARSLAVALAGAALAGGCGGDSEADSRDAGGSPAPGGRAVAAERPASDPPVAGPPRPPKPPACVDDSLGCERATGRILYVERLDPDGDGDAHFVLASARSITAPGISVIDVRTDLRPAPLPGPGDTLAASGPVFEGSYGQRQIQADAIVVGEAGRGR